VGSNGGETGFQIPHRLLYSAAGKPPEHPMLHIRVFKDVGDQDESLVP